MTIKTRQPGNNTYIRSQIKWIFDEKEINATYRFLVKEVGKDHPHIKLSDTSFHVFENWTELGPAISFSIRYGNNTISAECFRDGWHVKLITESYNKKELYKQVFGEMNRNYVWTRETERVPKIISDIINVLNNLGETNG